MAKPRVIAFIPVRGGSKSIPLKNIKDLAGKPLLHYSLSALDQCSDVDDIIVSTDHGEILKCALDFQSSKVRIHHRSAVNAKDQSSTESVMLEYLENSHHENSDLFVLVQATNPFTESKDFTDALKKLKKEKAQSLLSVVRSKRFFWSDSGQPFNYDFKKRPRRQDFPGMMMENGAFYISSVGAILKSKNRLSGKISVFEMKEESGFEIDEPSDWPIVEGLIKQLNSTVLSRNLDFSKVKLFLTDVDGVLTDAGMYYSEKGDELKKFNTLDGMGLQLLMKAGLKTGIVTGENTQLVSWRRQKLGLDFLFQGAKDKLTIVKNLCLEQKINLSEVAFIGDDINDHEILSHVGFPACPNSAVQQIKSIPGIRIMSKAGGQGVVREYCDLILENRVAKKNESKGKKNGK